MAMLGVPYGDAVNRRTGDGARTGRLARRRQLEGEGGPKGLQDKEIIALIAYLQRLGRDIKAPQVARSAP